MEVMSIYTAYPATVCGGAKIYEELRDDVKEAQKWLNYTETYSQHVFTFLINCFSTPLFPHQKRLKVDDETVSHEIRARTQMGNIPQLNWNPTIPS